MKFVCRKIALFSLLLAGSTTFATTTDNNEQPWNNSLSNLTTYFLNLGQYLGYNLQVSPSGTSGNNNSTTVSQTLLPVTTQLLQGGILLSLFDSFFGAELVNMAASSTQTQSSTTAFVPTNNAYKAINVFANSTFNTSGYTTPNSMGVSISSLIDQPTYQTDPVSQAVLNILTTPDYSYCLTNDGKAWAGCTYSQNLINENQVMQNVIGNNPPPDTQTFFTYNFNQPFLSQLNVNSLIAPLMYSTTSSTTSTSSATGNNTNTGLTAQTQAQQAANFIRYATAAVAPIQLPDRKQYDALFVKAQNAGNSYTQLEQFKAQSTIASYLTGLRIYAAQISVGVGNLYYILSKRMPQPIPGANTEQSNTTSQALSEFTMATWRLYNPDQSPNTTWLTQMNQASPATMQKEIAVLLAEINYQLYLSRQQQERLLLTESMILIQNSRQAQPNPNMVANAQTVEPTTNNMNP